MLESDVKSKWCGRFRDFGAMVLNVHGHGMQSSGWPDTQVFSRCWSGHIEWKVEDRAVSPKQRIVIKGLRHRFFGAFVIRWRMGGELHIEDENGILLAKMRETEGAFALLKKLRDLTETMRSGTIS